MRAPKEVVRGQRTVVLAGLQGEVARVRAVDVNVMEDVHRL